MATTPARDFPELSCGPHVTLLFGDRGGRYPSGNSLVVAGDEAALIDPSLGLFARSAAGRLPRVDRILLSHAHEDHMAGMSLFRELPCHVHEADLPALRSLDAVCAFYGYPEPIASSWRQTMVDVFRFTPRPDALPLRDGDVLDLGGVRVRVIHAPGHTPGHCLLHIEPDDVLYLGDVELSSFGPYYGDECSSLEDFERTLARVRELEARRYATFHHIGVLDKREDFLARLERFSAVIGDRERRLLEYLREPHSLDEIAEHRFVYRPGDAVSTAPAVERIHMRQHVARLLAAGRLEETEPGRYRTLAA